MRRHESLLLRRALLGNALFSTVSGLSLLAAAGVLDAPLGVPAVALRVVGVALLPFALALWRSSRRKAVDRTEAWVAVWLDFGWVAGSAALVVGELWPLKSAGVVAVLTVATLVLGFAVLQTVGLVLSAPRVARSGQS